MKKQTDDLSQPYAGKIVDSVTSDTTAQKPVAMAAKVITDCQDLLAAWIVPDSGITDQTVLNDLLGILDGPQARKALAKQEPVGYMLVPIEPTEAMMRAAMDCQDADPGDSGETEMYYAYKAMLASLRDEEGK